MSKEAQDAAKPAEHAAAPKAPGLAGRIVEEVFQQHFHNSPTFSQNVDIYNKLQEFKLDLLDRLREV